MLKTSGLPKIYGGIDIWKFIMSFAVVAIHAPEYLWPENRNYPFLIDWFIRLAVPFYFIASGYLIQSKLQLLSGIKCQRSYLRNRFYKLIRIWIIWSLIYLPLSIWGYYHEQGSICDKFTSGLYDLFLTGRLLYAQPLWFLYSMSITFLIWQFYLKYSKRLWGLVFIFGLITILGHVLKSDVYLNDYDWLRSIVTWVLGGGLPIICGAVVYKLRLLYLKNSVVILFCVSLACLIFSIVSKYYNWPFGPLCGGLLILVISLALKFNKGVSFDEMRDQSMWIYYVHMYVIIAFMVILRRYDININKDIMFVSLSFVVWLISFILAKLCKIKTFSKIGFLVK